ncbi:MAG TPA: XRE family transcriptional regulator [Bradyrhizobium sp.]|nr:XRE family transcriptional regulator [Bradyrhizobium sp.]
MAISTLISKMKKRRKTRSNTNEISKKSRRARSIPVQNPTPQRPVKQVKSFIDLWLGEQLRIRRQALGKSLKEVAHGCDISISLLSQLERGLRSASVRTLDRLARELDTPIETLVHNVQIDGSREDDAQGAITRSGRHRRIDSNEAGIHKEILTPSAVASSELQVYRAVIEPGGSTGNTFFTTTNGQQIGYVIEGTLELHVGERLFRLHTGDSFCYDSSMPRRWQNPGSTPTTVLWAVALNAGTQTIQGVPARTHSSRAGLSNGRR